MPARRKASPNDAPAHLGFEAKLWLAADTAPGACAAKRCEAIWQGPSEAKGKLDDISICGQESNSTTRLLAIMNLAMQGIEADFGKEHADTFLAVQHPDLRADYVLANPPFNDSDWHRKDDDVRWQFGVPPKGNANFAWVQHFIHHLAPHGMAGFVLANGSMSSNQSGDTHPHDSYGPKSPGHIHPCKMAKL